ncbi:uncharacterized protein [Panulirus ornatus]|uniref:uncharacterized protein n=1 Tax=Panulirus ornatus TaxID=150431 RepID=UPI003A8BE150
MATKNKSPRKRGRECLEMTEREDDLEPPVIIANIKKRKKTKDGVKTEKESKSSNTGLMKSSVPNTCTRTMTTSIVTLRRNRNSGSGWEHSISTSSKVSPPASDRGQNLASHVKKTYASGSKNMPVKKDRGRLKGNTRSRSSLHDDLSKEDKHESEVEEEKIKKSNMIEDIGNDTTGGPVLPLEVEPAHDVKDNVLSRFDIDVNDDSLHGRVHLNENCQSQLVHKDAVWKSEDDSSVCVTSDSCSEKIVSENFAKRSAKVTVGESSQAIESKMTTENHSILPTVSVSSDMQISPGHHPLPHVLQPVSCSGIPQTPVMPSLSANTTAITAIPTPIATFPVLSDKGRHLSGGTVYAVSFTNSDLQQESHNHDDASSDTAVAYTSHNSVSQVVSDPKCSSALDRNSLHVATFNSNMGAIGDHKNIPVSAHKTVEKRTPSVPVVDIEDENDSLSIERGDIPVSSISCTPATSTSTRETVSTSSIASSGGVHTSSDYVEDDIWGAYLLKNLEYLYDFEECCNLVLKFSSGETLKVHRGVMRAATALLLLENHGSENEIELAKDLQYASVEPVIRFVYSGRLDIRRPRAEISAIYTAASRIRVPLLMSLMEQHFPYLSSPPHSKSRLQIRRDKLVQQIKQQPGKGNSKTPSFRVVSFLDKLLGEVARGSTKDAAEDTSIRTVEEEDEDEGQDGSVYLLMTNSQKIAQANAAERRKRPAEEARPTRFELEEDTENTSVQIATWSSKHSPLPPFLTGTSVHSHNESTSSSSLLSSTVSVSPSRFGVHFTSSNSPMSSGKCSSSPNSDFCTRSLSASNHSLQPQDPFSVLTQVVSKDQNSAPKIEEAISTAGNSLNSNPKAFKEQEVTIQGQDEDDDIGKDGDELMEKINNICKQLEERDLDEKESNGEDYVACDYKMETKECETTSDERSSLSHVSKGETPSDSKNSLVLESRNVPVKSILKKKRDKSDTTKLKKHVSFPLDENNELINEVATYSHAKEPAQSLIEVQKRVGSFKSSSDSYSPVKLTLSLKKKVLMNLSLSDSEASESPSHENEKGKNKKDGSFACQSTSQGQVSKGDMSNHAKIISEVLKKYPHLVKDKKNIRLKILKKGSDKAGSGKLVKSKVQYLVLSESESKGKTCMKPSKISTSSGTKGDSNTSPRAIQNAKTYKCPECEDVFFSSFKLRNHVSAQHKRKCGPIMKSLGKEPYTCHTCIADGPIEFDDFCSYEEHMIMNHTKLIAPVCRTCGFQFQYGQGKELAYHEYIEHNEVPRNVTFSKCDLCDHVAVDDAALLKHRSQHANGDSFTCSVCGFVFRSFGHLQGHMLTKVCQNKRSNSHKCPHCPLTFNRSYNLKAHCKSSHRAIHTTVQIAPGSPQKQPDLKHQEEVPVGSGETDKPTETNSSSGGDQGELDVEGMCETLTSIGSQSSSEAEALSTVANSLAASLGLPEETVNHYMYSQGGKLDFSGSLDGEKYEEGIARPTGMSVQLVDAATSGSGYQVPICNDRTFTSQAPMPNTTNVGALYPVSVVPSQLMSNQLVPGQILPSQMLQSGGGSVLGAAPHSWAYVTYQVPTTSDDLPSVIAEGTTLNTTTKYWDSDP